MNWLVILWALLGRRLYRIKGNEEPNSNENDHVSKNGKYSNELLKKFYAKREAKELIDVEFIVGEEKRRVAAHRIVLASTSEVFAAMFAKSRFGSKVQQVVIVEVSGDIFEMLIEFCYSGDIDISAEIADALLEAAHRFHVVGLVNVCWRHLTKHFDPNRFNEADYKVA